MAKKNKTTHIRKFLDTPESADSYVHLTIYPSGDTNFKLADCSRTVNLNFYVPGDKRSIKKAKALKDVVDALYEHLLKEST